MPGLGGPTSMRTGRGAGDQRLQPPGALIHKFHNTVSMIRTIEMLLGIPPMNQLDASAVPMDIFQESPDLAPYRPSCPRLPRAT